MPWRMGRWVIPRRRVILDLCGGTGSWSAPYRTPDYEVYVVDPDRYLEAEFMMTVQQFAASIPRSMQPVVGILAAPPCTVFSKASARLWKDYDADGRTQAGIQTVLTCLELIDRLQPKWWALENPGGRLADYIGPPSWSFQPWEYGDPYTKQTHIWGTARKPPPTHEPPEFYDRRIDRRGGSSPKTKTLRSITPPGFAQAFAKENR